MQIEYKRITRQIAKELYDKDRTIYVLPCNQTPEKTVPYSFNNNTWKHSFAHATEQTHRRLCNATTGDKLVYYTIK